MSKINTCFCLKCDEKKKVGKSASEVIDGEYVSIVCDECKSELYNYKINVQKKKGVKADHKARNVKG